MVYRWKDGTHFKTSPDVVHERIEAIRAAKGGSLTDADLVADARPATSPIHREFEWNNLVAAKEYREIQARRLITAMVRIEETDELQVPQQVYVGYGTRQTGPMFTTLVCAMNDDEIRERVFAEVRRQLAGLRRRLAGFEGAVDAVAALDAADVALQGCPQCV